MKKSIILDKEELTGKFNKATIGSGRKKLDLFFIYGGNRLKQIDIEGSREALPSNYDLTELICKLSLLEEQKNLLVDITDDPISTNLVYGFASTSGGPTIVTLYTVPEGKKLIIDYWSFKMGANENTVDKDTLIGYYLISTSAGSPMLAFSTFRWRGGSDFEHFEGSYPRPLPPGSALKIYAQNADTHVSGVVCGVLINA